MRNSNIVFKILLSALLYAAPLFAGEKVAVVLSGGGAQAMAHIGVLRAFEEEQIPIDYLIGSSGGSIIGGLYAAGVSLDELEEMVRNGTIMKLFLGRKEPGDLPVYERAFRKSGSFSIFENNGSIKTSPGLLNDKLIWKELFLLTAPAEYRAHSNFDSLLIPFRAIGADVVNRKAVAIGSGSLSEALRISMSMPLIYPPVIRGNKMFLDGGIYAKVPVFAAQNLKADVIVAVNAGDPTPAADEVHDVFDFFDAINALLFSYSDSINVKGWDYYINIDTEGFNVFDFAGGETLITRGYLAGKKAAQKIGGNLKRRRHMQTFKEEQALFRNALDGVLIDSIQWINKKTGKQTAPEFNLALPFVYSAHRINSLLNALYATHRYESITPMLGGNDRTLRFIVQKKARWSATPEIKINSVNGFFLMTNLEYHNARSSCANRFQGGIGNRKANYRYSFSPVHFWYADNSARLNYFWELRQASRYHAYRVQKLPNEDIKFYSSEIELLNHFVLSWNQELIIAAGMRYRYWKNINQDSSVLFIKKDIPIFYPFVKISYQYNRLKRVAPFVRGWKMGAQLLAGNEKERSFYSFALSGRMGVQLSKKYHFGLDVSMQNATKETPLEALAQTPLPAAFTELLYFDRLAYASFSVVPAFTASFFRSDVFVTAQAMHSYLQNRVINRRDGWSSGWDTYITYNSILGQLQLGWSIQKDTNYQVLSWTKVHIYL